MDPEALEALGRRFWYTWTAAMLTGAGAVVAALAVLRPDDAWVVAIYALLAVVFAGFVAVTLALDERLDALGQAIGGIGLVVVAIGIARGYSDTLFWGGLGLAVVGSTISLWADHGEQFRSALGR